MRFALTLLGACWQPDPWTPPPPPPEAVDALAAVDDEGDEGDETGGEDDTGEDDGDDVAEAPASPPIDPWQGRLLQAPVTIVDDYGKPLLVVGKDVRVEVRAAEPHRVKVFCAECTPPTEGWVQVQLVAPVE